MVSVIFSNQSNSLASRGVLGTMPKKNSPFTLKKLSLLSISRNVDRYWSTSDDCFSSGKFILLLGPFDCLPGNLAEDLIDTLREEKTLKPKHVQMLISLPIERLSLHGWAGDLNRVVRSLTLCSKKLVHVDIGGCTNISKTSYLDLIRNLPCAVVLKLQYTQCNDEVLTCIKDWCPRITELDLTNCPVTDEGAKNLCNSLEEVDQVAGAKQSSISKLYIEETNISPIGAKYLIKNLPKLVILKYERTFDAIELLHRKDICCLHDVKKYNLRMLSASYPFDGLIGPEAVLIVTLLCPQVTRLQIINADMSSEDIVCLANFQNLQELQLVIPAVFSEGISSFLQIRGNTLRSLHIGEVIDVDVNVIASFCSNLTSFSLFLCNGLVSTSSAYLPSSSFSKLKTFGITVAGERDLPHHAWKLILKSAVCLEVLSVTNSSNFDDDLTADITSVNLMPSLSTLKIEACPNISGQALKWFLLADNQLERLICCHCKSVTLQDYQEWQRLVRQNNWVIDMMWL